jgi:hypothetical protein
MALSKGWKIALSIVGVMGLLFVLGVGALFYWVKTNGKAFVEGQMTAATQRIEEGQQHGLETDQAGCVKTTLAKLNKDAQFSALVGHRFFLQGCLQTGQPTAGFCEGVPRETDVIQSVKWRLQACKQYGSASPHCSTTLAGIQGHCATAAKDAQR